MGATVEVRFKGNRRSFFRWGEEDQPPLAVDDPVVVEVERGRDLGHVSAVGEVAERKCGGCTSCDTGAPLPAAATQPAPSPPIVRRATSEDVATHHELRRSEEEVRRKVLDRVRHHRLAMKVSDAEWQWDRNKLTVYFTAEKRVDFRALVRDLASTYRTRIELRQIGVRDEAARLSGVGRCGREFCCSTWLTELSPVSLALAKDQHLSLNPSQISGGCGRLLCCLKYEHEFYVAARKRFPKEGKTLVTAVGPERVVAVDIFRERVFLRSEAEGPRIISLVDLREEIARQPPVHQAAEPGPAPPPADAAPADAPPPDQAQADPTPRRRPRRRRRGRRRGRPDAGSES